MGKLEKEVKMKTCFFCRGQVNLKKVEHIYHWKGKIYLFKNVTSEVCEQCGETFFLPESLRAMENAIQYSKKAESEVRVPVFSLG